MERRQKVLDYLDRTGIPYEYYEHPEAPTIEIARQYWHDDGSKHCKNLFFRNHKGVLGRTTRVTATTWSYSIATGSWPSTTSSIGSGKGSFHSLPNSAWNAISDCAPVRYHLSG